MNKNNNNEKVFRVDVYQLQIYLVMSDIPQILFFFGIGQCDAASHACKKKIKITL